MAGEQLWPEQSPEELRCPITNELMDDPVMAADGYTYDRAYIADWIEFNYTSPTTGARISSELIPNNDKKVQIDQWKAAQTKRMNGPCDIEPLLARVAWANSSHEACTELTNLSSIVTQNQLLVPEHKLRRMRLCLSSDENVWCPRVAQLLDGLQTSSTPANNSNKQPEYKGTALDRLLQQQLAFESTNKSKNQPVISARKSNEGECKRVTIWNPKERKKSSGNRAPYAKNLEKYLLSHPDWEVYDGQDKKRSYRTLPQSVASAFEPIASSLLCESISFVAGKTEAPAKEEQATGGLMALWAATRGVSDDQPAPSAPATPTLVGRLEGLIQVTPQMHKRKISEVGEDTSGYQLTKTCKTNHQRRPIVKALTVHMQLLPHPKAEADAKAAVQTKAEAPAPAPAPAPAIQAKAEAEAQAKLHAAAVAQEVQAAAQANAAAQVKAIAGANDLVQQHFQAANSKLAAFLTKNAPKSPVSSFLLSQQAGAKKPAQQPVVTKRRKTNKDNYLEITAITHSQRVRENGGLMFVDETKSQEQCWSSNTPKLTDNRRWPFGAPQSMSGSRFTMCS